MALVTQADVDQVAGFRNQIAGVRVQAGHIEDLLGDVLERIDMNEDMNDNTDFATIVTKYQPRYDAKLTSLKALAEALPRWNQV